MAVNFIIPFIYFEDNSMKKGYIIDYSEWNKEDAFGIMKVLEDSQAHAYVTKFIKDMTDYEKSSAGYIFYYFAGQTYFIQKM